MSKRMPVLFSGHGSPMLALEQSDATRELRAVGERVIEQFGKPKAILSISAHWYTRGTFVQTAESPKQVYDMYGFPKELYDYQYPVQGCPALGERVCEVLGDRVRVSNNWGIDHGTWTVLCHMFPTADIPVVQLSVDGTISREAILEIGRQLAPLRDEGYLIFASGNVVHNLRRVEWENPNGSEACIAFNETVKDKIAARDDRAVMQYEKLEHAAYAVPTPDHFLPLLYTLGAAEGEKPAVFNDRCNLGAIAMTGFAFGMDEA